jgi:hypothetical protein
MNAISQQKMKRSQVAGQVSALVAALLATSILPSEAADFTDIWNDRRQPGTHISIAQQNDRLHITIATYDGAGNPVWYVAPNAKIYGYINRVGGPPQFAGDLYAMRREQIGINFGEPVGQPVGRIHVDGKSATRLDIETNINGVVTRTVNTRMTWRQDDFAEGYAISYFGRQVTSPEVEGGKEVRRVTRYLGEASYEVFEGKARMTIEANGARCHYVGFHVPSGRIASIVGNFRCTSGAAGTFEMTEFSASTNGFSAALKTVSSDYRVTDAGSLGGGRNGRFKERTPDEEPELANDSQAEGKTGK